MYNGACTYIATESLTEQSNHWNNNGAGFTYYKAEYQDINLGQVTSADMGASGGIFYDLTGKALMTIASLG